MIKQYLVTYQLLNGQDELRHMFAKAHNIENWLYQEQLKWDYDAKLVGITYLGEVEDE
jgi:hypothetical protein